MIMIDSYQPEEDSDDSNDLLALIDSMSIDDLKANFQGLMGNVVTQYGDDQEGAQ